MISPTEARELFIGKFNIYAYCKELDDSFKDYLTSDLSLKADYVIGYLHQHLPDFVLEKIAKQYTAAGWNYVYYFYRIESGRSAAQFKLSMSELNPAEVKDYKVVRREYK